VIGIPAGGFSLQYLAPEPMDDPARWALTWRAWLRKHSECKETT
jgi:hypothetical protein